MSPIYTKGSHPKTRIFQIQTDHKGWRYPCAHYWQNIDWKIICWFGLVCLCYLCYQIPQLCKCKYCEVSWNWLNCRVIMFCTPVLDYLTGGLPKQLLDKLVLNRCPKLDLPACKFEQRYQNLKIMAGCRSMLGGHFFTQIHLCSDPWVRISVTESKMLLTL